MASGLEGKWKVYASPAFEELASRFGPVTPISRDIFDNGHPNILLHGIQEIHETPGGANVVFFHQYSSMTEKKIEEMVIFVLADTFNVSNLIVVDPYDPSATMERVVEEGRIATANVDAHFWRTLPHLTSGRKIIRIIYDQHTLQNRFYFSDGATQVVLRSAVPLLKAHLEGKGWSPQGQYAIAFPDAGACKRFGSSFPGYHLITCAKQRIGDERVVVIEDGEPKGKNVIIVDDLVRSGGTILECAKKLVESGSANVSVFCTHGEFPNQTWKKFLPESCPIKFESFIITDSCPTTIKQISGQSPFVVLSVMDDVRRIISSVSP